MKKTKHDRMVRNVARGYKSRGYRVKAAVSGYKTPNPIYGKIADIVAKKGKQTRIVEVETQKSYKRDTPQRAVFKRFAARSKNRKFRTRIARQNMKCKYSKEEFDRFFPRGPKQSKENVKRYVANYMLNKGYSLKDTCQFINRLDYYY